MAITPKGLTCFGTYLFIACFLFTVCATAVTTEKVGTLQTTEKAGVEAGVDAELETVKSKVSISWKQNIHPYKAWAHKLSKMDPTPMPGIDKTIGFLSFPSSGTDWVQILIATITGVTPYTKDGEEMKAEIELDDDEDAVQTRMLHGREAHQKDTFLVKDYGCWSQHREAECSDNSCHKCVKKLKKDYDGIIHLVRNPFDNMYARYNDGCWDPSLDCSNEALKARNGPWHKFVRMDVPIYAFSHCSFSEVSHELPSLTVVYEDILEDPVPQLQRILAFMGETGISDYEIQQAIDELPPSQDKVIHVDGIPEYWDKFSDEDVQYIHQMNSENIYNHTGPDCRAVIHRKWGW